MCASHNGEDIHTSTVSGMLEKIGIEECRRLIELHDKLMEWQGLSPTGAITTGALGEDDD